MEENGLKVWRWRDGPERQRKCGRGEVWKRGGVEDCKASMREEVRKRGRLQGIVEGGGEAALQVQAGLQRVCGSPRLRHLSTSHLPSHVSA